MSPPSTTRARLARWLHPYASLAAGTFLVGALMGIAAMTVTPPDALRALAGSTQSTSPFPTRLTTWTVFRNNIVVLGIVAAGVGTFAATTVLSLLFNGFILGVVAAAADRPLAVLALVAPHGVFELGAFFLVGGVAYRVTWRLISYLRGVDATPATRRELIDAAVLVLLGAVVLALAAWIEATLTRRIARMLVDTLP